MTHVALVLAYLLGSISFSWVTVRIFKGTDLRTQGSGNLGAKNTLRSMGLVPAIVVFVGDAGKGWLALYLSTQLAPESNLLLLAALFVLLGHIFPFWLGFRGGKGLATLVGISIFLNPLLLLALLTIAAIGLRLTRKTNPAAIIAMLAFPFLLYATVDIPWALLWGIGMAAIILYRHLRDVPDLVGRKKTEE
jgi:glycerol-3-phosphate acyltransferase PlsY